MQQAVTAAFARSIFSKVTLLRSAELSVRERQRVLEAISGDIRKYTDMAEHEVSEAAAAVAMSMDLDLHKKRWHDQPRFDPGRRRFVVDHLIPVNQIRGDCVNAESAEEVERCLVRGRVAWILREEDQTLTKLGYRLKRPDPEGAYRAAGIVLANVIRAMRDDDRP